MDNREKKAEECVANLSAVMSTYKSSCIPLYSVSASSGPSARFSAHLKQLHRQHMQLHQEEMIHIINEFFASEASDAPTVPSPIFPFEVASLSQAAVPSQVGPTSVDLSIAGSQSSHEQHQQASNTSATSINSDNLPTGPVSAHPNNVESSGHMMSHLQFASGSASGHSAATVASSISGQVQFSARQGSDMTANQYGEGATNSLVSENVVDVQAHGQQRATVSTAVTPNVDAHVEMAILAAAGNSNANANPSIDNVSVKEEIESPSSILVSNYNYEEAFDDESIKDEDTDYISPRCINVSSDDEEDNLEESVTNANEQIENANSCLAIQAEGAPLTTTVTNAGDDEDTSSEEDDDDWVSIKSEDTSECESDCDSMLAIEDIKEENDDANEIDPLMGHSGAETSTRETFAQAANTEPVQALPTDHLASLHSTSTGRRSTRAKKPVNYRAPIMDDSFTRKRVNYKRKNKSQPGESESSDSSDDEEFGGPLSAKRKASSSGAAAKKAKHSHTVQQSTVAAAAVGPSVRDEPMKVITKSLNCPQADCNEVCKSKKSLNRHLRVKHAIERYRCIIANCTASFKAPLQLKKHRPVHGNGSDLRCGSCENAFNHYRELRHHHYRHHEEGLFECSIDTCDFKESTRGKLYTHANCHRTLKYICPVANCGRGFAWKSYLKQHLRTHTQARPSN